MDSMAGSNLAEEQKLHLLFDMYQAYVDRTKITFSLLFLRWHPSCKFPGLKEQEQYHLLYDFISRKVRNADKVFSDAQHCFVIVMLAFSGKQEAEYFLNRIVHSLQNEFSDICLGDAPSLLATINEIANKHCRLQDIISKNLNYLNVMHTQPPNAILPVTDFAQFPIEKVKVSIIENNTISILENVVANLQIDNIEIEIRCFEDGLQFLSSDWYQSGHTHLVILDDILPKKNGLEVMHTLRSLPNDEKYIIMLMSDRDSDETMIRAFDQGADAYFKRPFNLRLVEAQIKNTLRRLHQ